MSTSNNIPEQDAELVRYIGQWLDSGLSLDDYPHTDVQELVTFRKSTPQPGVAQKERVWRGVKLSMQQTGSQSKPVTLQFPSSQVRAWAVAASIFIIAFTVIFFLQRPKLLQPIAQVSNDIETVTLSDGSEVTLRPNSALYLIEESPGKQAYKLEGEGYFSVSPDPARLFSVQTERGTVEVLGTRFTLREWGGQTELFLEEGSVQLLLSDRSDYVVLEPGQRAAVSPANKIVSPEPFDAEEFNSWRNRVITFSNRSAASILRELEFHYGIEIEAPVQILKEQLGGSITLQNREDSLQDLGVALGGEFVTHDGRTYQFVSQN